MAFRKQKKGLNLILLLLLMVLLIVGLIWVTNYKEKKESEGSETSDDSTVVVTMDKESISKIHFTVPENDMTLVSQDGTWLYEADKNLPVNQTRVKEMVNAFSSITANRTISEGINDLSEFGLSEPTAIISASQTDGTTTTVKIGSEVPITGGYYATINDDGKLYILPESFYTNFEYTLVQMTEVESIPSITAGNITKLSVTNKDKESFEVVYDDNSSADISGNCKYIINKPYAKPIPADSDAITTLFGNYTSMSFSSCIDYNATDLSKYGLDNPTSEIDISYYEEITNETENTDETESDDKDSSDNNGSDETSNDTKNVTRVYHELKLLIGGTDESGNYYAKLSDSNAVNLITASKVSTLTDIAAYDNTYKYINMINIDIVDSIDIEVDNTTYQLSIERSTKTEDGEEKEVAKYYINGTEVEEDDFKTLYRVIIAPKTEREIPEGKKESSNVPYMKVTYHLNTNTTATIEYLPYDKNYYVVNSNGIKYFLVDLRSITAITDNLLEYVK